MNSSSPPLVPALIYRSLLWLLTPYLRWRFYKEGKSYGDSAYAKQRRGLGLPRFNAPPLWLHAASVGEFHALLPLIQALCQQHPPQTILLTTNTASSGKVARDKLPQGVTHAYLPVDQVHAMQRFLACCQPRLGIIMETELWPNLYRLCNQRDIPLVIINGRISEKTLRAPAWLRRLYRYCLQQTAQILARSELDRERFLRLGADGKRCRLLGNIKFAALNSEPPSPIELGRDYVLAASSREEEERLIVQAWQQSGRDELLVIAPRHPQRLEAILNDLQPFGLNIAVRSRGEQPDATTHIYIADTFGELRSFIAGAQLVFMGGSLVDKGGHNILEPAALGKAVITGPHMANFLDETRILLEGEGLIQVDSVQALAQVIGELLQGTEKRQLLGENARATVARHADALERYLEALGDYL